MPREHKQRGRRQEKKRKREEGEEDVAPSKKQKSEEAAGYIPLHGVEGTQGEEQAPVAAPGDPVFYGLLDDADQEYFKRADTLLELNQFENADERDLFVENVFKEAKGKELKIANSQSCSRLMERLIQMSTPKQLKALFQIFSGHFLNLVQHRFASHCCETLFLKAAPIVTSELIAPPEAEGQVGVGEVYVSMENLFLYACNEFEGNLGYLMTDQFASHPIRVLLIVLSGMPLSTSSSKSLLQSKKKENVTVSGNTATAKEMETQTRSVPDAFQSTINGMISGMIHGLNTTNLRALANHPISNPILQLLLEIELGQFGKHNAKIEDSLFRKLLPDDPLTKDTESAAFVNSLIYDTIGSRLLETVVVHAPGKTFKALYKCSFGEQLGTLAKNETAAFVVTRIIERLNKDDLQVAVDHILPQIATLIERSRTTVIKTLIDRCRVRQLDLQPISGALERAHGTDSGITDDWLTKMLKFEETSKDDMAEDRKNRLQNQDSSRVHASLLAQCMLETPGPLRQLITESILSTDTPVIIRIAKDRTASRVIQSALVCLDDDTKFRRVFVPGLYSHIKYLATDPVASHVVDSLWGATTRLTFMRERIARELAEHETAVRESIPGKAVWRNWKMDLYKRRRKDWSSEVKGHGASVKSSIELARERFAAGKAGNHRKRFRAKPQTNSNVNSIPLNAPTIQGEA